MPKATKPSLQNILEAVRANQAQVRGQGVILEEMRSQNRATIEAVEATRVVLEGKIDAVARETGRRLTILETAVRGRSISASQSSSAMFSANPDAGWSIGVSRRTRFRSGTKVGECS